MQEPCVRQVEAAWSSETLINFQWTAWCYIPKEILYKRHLEPLHFLIYEGVETSVSSGCKV
jgi:hypothetical protein